MKAERQERTGDERRCVSGSWSRRCAVILIVAVSASLCLAGEVLLGNGDRLSGEVEKIIDGKLYFKSDLVGPVTIDMANVKTFSTDKADKIVLSDETVVNRQLTASDAGRVSLVGGSIIQGQDVKLTDITALNPPEKESPRWKGSVSAGITSVHGNAKSETVQGSVSAGLRREKDRTTLGADYGRAKQEDPDTGAETTSEDWWKLRGKYDYFLSKKFYSFLEGRYETDKVADLDRRVIGGVGVGYQWIESEGMNFSTEVGLANLSERFNDGTSNNEVSAQAGYHFDVKLNDRIDFINDLTYYPSIQQYSDYFLTTTVELRASLVGNMFANFRTIFDYDTSPARGKGSTDVKHILGVGWDF